MSESTINVGNIVFAGDLVKVQHGTKYFNINYYDALNIPALMYVDRRRAYKDLRLSSYSDVYDRIGRLKIDNDQEFLYWLVNGKKYSVDDIFEKGLSSDVDALSYIKDHIDIVYNGNGANVIDADTGNKQDYGVQQLSTLTYVKYDDELSDYNQQTDYIDCEIQAVSSLFNDFSHDDIRYHYRFNTWQYISSDSSNIISVLNCQPGETLHINHGLELTAEWVKQYKLWISSYNLDDIQLSPICVDNCYDISGTTTGNILITTSNKSHYILNRLNLLSCDNYDIYSVPSQVSTINANGQQTFTIQLSSGTVLQPIYTPKTYKITVEVVGVEESNLLMWIGNKRANKFEINYAYGSSNIYKFQPMPDANHNVFIEWYSEYPLYSAYTDTILEINTNKLTSDVSISAVFKPINNLFAKTFVYPSNAGKIILNKQNFSSNDSINISIENTLPNIYTFNAVYIDDKQLTNIETIGNIITADYMITSDITISAVFDTTIANTLNTLSADTTLPIVLVNGGTQHSIKIN